MRSGIRKRRWLMTLVSMCCLLLSTSKAADMPSVLAEVDNRIEKYRKGNATIRVVFPGGELASGAEVQVDLQRHAFRFGAMFGGFESANNPQEETAYRNRFAEVMNAATILFIWDGYEPQPGSTKRANRMRAARWCKQRNISMCGHTLVWNMEPTWLQRLPPAQSETRLWNRISDNVTEYRGLIDRWVVVNETTEGLYHARAKSAATLLNAFEQYGIPNTVAKSYRLARGANPDATLLLNDYEVTEKYERNIRRCVDAGADIDVVGIQSHMHQGYWGAEKIWDVCDRFAKLGKPIEFTEVSVLSGRLMANDDNDWATRRKNWRSTAEGERIQAEQVREIYQLLFSHPDVVGISWWDLTDRYAWMAAPAGLLREDFSPKPAYYVVRDLVKKGWSTHLRQAANAEGEVAMRGFYGDYSASVTRNGRAYAGTFRLTKGDENVIQVRLEPVANAVFVPNR